MQAGHALVGALMPEYDPVQKISIVPRGQAGGLTFFAPSEERLESGLYSKTYLENQLSVALGGRVAEEVIFGEDDVTTGASSDFMQVLGHVNGPIFQRLVVQSLAIGNDCASQAHELWALRHVWWHASLLDLGGLPLTVGEHVADLRKC